MEDRWQIPVIEDAATRIAELAHAGDLDEPVAHLNRWKVRDVVAHLGGVHRWAVRIVQARSMEGPGFTKSKLDGAELCDWFEEGARMLLDLLDDTDLAEPCPNFNPGSDATVGWWARRQAHESSVHRWDVEKAIGKPTAIAGDVAVDGVDEFLDVFVRTRGKQTLASALRLRTTRPRAGWTLTPATKPGRIDVATAASGPAHEAAATVSGTPEALLLALWGRQTATEAKLSIEGDPDVAASLLRI